MRLDAIVLDRVVPSAAPDPGIVAARRGETFDETELRFSGADREGVARVAELTDHPFFVGTAFQPERDALAGEINPIVGAFFQAGRESAAHR